MKIHLKNFLKFIIIGLLWSGINVIFMWLFVEILGISAFISSTISIIAVHIGRFYSYVMIRLIHPHFWKFTYTNIIFTLLNIILMSLAIDVLKINTIIASIIVVGGLFISKFFSFNKINLIRE